MAEAQVIFPSAFYIHTLSLKRLTKAMYGLYISARRITVLPVELTSIQASTQFLLEQKNMVVKNNLFSAWQKLLLGEFLLGEQMPIDF